ncbi:MAG: hypothetical protein HEQ16_04085 [Bosea sp.]|jgi:hypothetical protein|nr:hypothetical protein [Bosea sp. (in: a-proteobacteria)]
MLSIALLAFMAGAVAAFFMPLLAFCLFGAVAAALVGIAAGTGVIPGLSVIPAVLWAAFTLQIGFGMGIGIRALGWPGAQGKAGTRGAPSARGEHGRQADASLRARHARSAADEAAKPGATDTGSV